MGGKKKRSLRKAERAQKRKPGKKRKTSEAAPAEKKSVPGITPPNVKSEKLAGELKKMKVLTPYSIASRYDLRLSIARKFLKELERTGMIEFVSSSRHLKIYKPVD